MNDGVKKFFLDKHGEDATSLRPMEDVHSGISVPKTGSVLRRFFAFAGPALLVSVGYMDPGNWGTDLAGGATYGYKLMWVILASSLMAMLLQTFCVRLGIATGHDLAQACRTCYKKPANIVLWILCELAIIACDLAEVIGSAVALNLLFNIPIIIGVFITGFDVLILLAFMQFGFRKIEAVILTLVGTIGACFLVEVILAQPHWGSVLMGTFVPSLPDKQALYVSLGILGATVMPHNLYLHSALVHTRDIEQTPAGKRQAIAFNTWDTIIALGLAFFVNAAILVLAGAVFHTTGHQNVENLGEAHRLLAPLLGTSIASTAFALALLASGQSSTITGTLAGQIVMEGFLHIRIKPWLRRIISRVLAIIPAVIMIYISGGHDTVGLLVISQVVLSMQLPFAIFPLLMFTSNPHYMGEFVNPTWLKIIGYAICIIIAMLNFYLLVTTINYWWVIGFTVAGGIFSLWVMYFYHEKDEDKNAIRSQSAA